ncbi:MAG: hypothetical protein ABR503_00425, partial [Chitinophagaceae bacterium]
LILSLLLFPLFSRSQDCKLKKEVDDFTHETKISTGFVPFSKGLDQVLLSIDADSKEVQFFFAFKNAGESKCFDDASTAVIFFEGSKLKSNFKNSGSMNCEGLFHITFRNSNTTPTTLQNLSTKKISSIQLTGNNKKSTIIVLSDNEKLMLMDMVTCAIKESKTLIK